jgi:hypothetical protein
MIALTFTLAAFLAAALVATLVLLDRERERHRAETAVLLQRILAPQVAVAEHHAAVTSPIGPEESMPMTDHEIAAAEHQGDPSAVAERDALIAYLEAVENGDQSMLAPPPIS